MKIKRYTDGRAFVMGQSVELSLIGGKVEEEIELEQVSESDKRKLFKNPKDRKLIDKLKRKA